LESSYKELKNERHDCAVSFLDRDSRVAGAVSAAAAQA
jgi:hypothetical protein